MFSRRYGLQDAVIAGTKPVSRRLIGQDVEVDWNRRGKVHLPISGFNGVLFMDCSQVIPCGKFEYSAPGRYQPRFEVGEVVAVAQSYKEVYDEMEESQGNGKANEWWCELYDHIGDPSVTSGYRNKMFVQADLMPHRIRITDVRAERLQEITDEDCIKEGVVPNFGHTFIVTGIMENRGRNNKCFDTPREAFAALIDRISGHGTWKSNPWVYAYEFELIR